MQMQAFVALHIFLYTGGNHFDFDLAVILKGNRKKVVYKVEVPEKQSL